MAFDRTAILSLDATDLLPGSNQDEGSMIKAIGDRARYDSAGLLDRPIRVCFNVKERKGWDKEGARLRAIGLEDPGKP